MAGGKCRPPWSLPPINKGEALYLIPKTLQMHKDRVATKALIRALVAKAAALAKR